jgi:hypothetical protein
MVARVELAVGEGPAGLVAEYRALLRHARGKESYR